jgi:hypothetical protein
MDTLTLTQKQTTPPLPLGVLRPNAEKQARREGARLDALADREPSLRIMGSATNT